LASSFTLLLPPPELSLAGAGVEVLAELVVGVSAAVLAVEEELDDELPQPANASSAAGTANSENRAFERIEILQ
jgi:hypothetical protein